MSTYTLTKSFTPQIYESEKTESLCRIFGVTKERLSQTSARHNCTLKINDGDIIYITGASGCGKSILLTELENQIPADLRINIDDFILPEEKALIDCIDGDVLSSMRILTNAGLGDVFNMLNSPRHLSEGQKYRFRLAMALASGKKFIFADEFCSQLDRITAGAVCYSVRRFAKRNNVTFILASSHDDIVADLMPDCVVIKDFCGNSEVIYKNR